VATSRRSSRLFYPFAERAAAFAEIKALNESELYQAEGDRETERAIERGEMWVYVNGFWDNHLAFQAGRQNFEDDREWWWDAGPRRAAHVHELRAVVLRACDGT
jgi:hypothetical protein